MGDFEPIVDLYAPDIDEQDYGEDVNANWGLIAKRLVRQSVNAAKFDSLNAAAAEVDDDWFTVLIGETTTVTTDLVIPETMILDPQGEALIDIPSGVQLTIQSSTRHWPTRPIFSGTGTVIFDGPDTEICPLWWEGTFTHQLQSACTAGSRNTLGLDVRIPAGWYEISQYIYIHNCYGFRLYGAGPVNTTLEWTGPSNQPMFLLSDLQAAYMADMQITTEGTLQAGVQSIRENSLNLTPGYCHFERVRILPSGSGYIGKGFVIGGSGLDQNNDFHTFTHCQVLSASLAAYSIENSQVYAQLYYNCIAVNCGRGLATTYAATSTAGSFFWYGGETAGSTVADFNLKCPAGPCLIEGCTSEFSRRFMLTEGPSGEPSAVTIEALRFYTGENSDGGAVGFTSGDDIIDFRFPGVFIVRGNYFQVPLAPTPRAFVIKWNPGGGGGRGFIFEGNYVQRTHCTTLADLFTQQLPTSFHSNWQRSSALSINYFDPNVYFVGPAQITGNVQIDGVLQHKVDQQGNKSGSWTPNMALGNIKFVTMTGNVAMQAPTNAKAGHILIIVFRQDATGGRVLTYQAGTFLGNFTPTTTASAFNAVAYWFDGLFWWQFADVTNLAFL